MSDQPSLRAYSTRTTTTAYPLSSCSSSSSLHLPPPDAYTVDHHLRPLSISQVSYPSPSRPRPHSSSSSAWEPTYTVSDSQMLNEHTVMSAEGFVAIPKSPVDGAYYPAAVAGGKKDKEKGKTKRSKVFALGKLVMKEVLGGGGNNNNINMSSALEKDVIASSKNKAVHSYGRGGAARPKYKTTLLQPPTVSSAQSAENTQQAQALRKTLTPLSAPHLPTHTPPSSHHKQYPPAPASVGPATTRQPNHRPSLPDHPPPPPSSFGSASVVSAPVYCGGEYHHHRAHPQPHAHRHHPQDNDQHMRRKSSLSLQSATLTSSSSGSSIVRTPSTAGTSWMGSSPVSAASAQGCFPPEVERSGRRRSLSESEIAQLAEGLLLHDQQQQQVYRQQQRGIYGPPPSKNGPAHLGAPTVQMLDAFVPPLVQRKASMQELQQRTRPAPLYLGGTATPRVPDVVIDEGTPQPSVESSVAFSTSSPQQQPPPQKRTSKPIGPRENNRASVAGGGGGDDTEWVLSESVTVVGFPTTRSSDSFQFDTKEGVKRSVSGVRRRVGEVLREEDEEAAEDNRQNGVEGDETPRGRRQPPTPVGVAHSSPPYVAPMQQQHPPIPPPYASPLPQLRHQQSVPQLPTVPALASLLAGAPALPGLLPQLGGGFVPPQAPALQPQNLLALLAAASPHVQKQQQQQHQQQLQALELYLALANMNLALTAEQMRSAANSNDPQ